jgi:hypothetical protein
VNAGRLDRATVVTAWMLRGIAVDDELVEGHSLRARVLAGQ